MADNTLLNAGTGGDTVRDIDRAGVKTQVVQLDAGGSSAESLISGTNPLPAKLSDGTNVVVISTPNSDSDSGDMALATESYNKGWNGTSWDRIRMSTTGGMAISGNDGSVYRTLKVATDGTLLINGVQDSRVAQTFVGSGAASNTGVSISNRNVVTFSFAGTYATFTVLFEASDDGGTTYYPLQTINNATGLAGSSATLAANATATYDAAVGGYTHVRVRTAAGPATGTCNVGINTQVFAYDPVVAAISQGVAASGSTISGNPVLAGWTFTTTLPTVTTGQAVNAQSTNRGELLVALSSGATAVAVKAASTAAATTDPALVVSMAGANSAVKVGDGTNNAAIKAASTAAAFTDPALTVDPRPGGALVTASAALADAFANPTLGKQAVCNLVYNGSTWDLQRGMSGNLTTGDTGAKTANGNGATQTNVGNKGATIVFNIGTVSGTTPVFVGKIQGSTDGGTTWYDIPGATTGSIAATGVFAVTVYPGAPTVAGTSTSISGTASCGQPLPRTWRVVWTIGGTTPSFTITNVQVNYHPN